jgi:serine/threonine protein kinase
LPRRLYLRRRTSLEAIHPLAVFVEEGERFACFSALGRRAEYLDYASGELLDAKLLAELHPTLERELEALFKRRAPEKETPETQSARRFGDYEILGKLGEGAMGAVYLARQRTLDRLVALKMLPWDRAQDPVALGRFKREVKALSRCEHPNVVKIFSYGETAGTHYYAMEYVEGSDLRRVARFLSESSDFETAISSANDAMRAEHKELFENLPAIERHAPSLRRGESRELQLARFFRDAAQGLAHLHERGVLHRDISPGNLMATASEGRAVVMDLGLAAVEGVSLSLTKDKSQILGTLRYIAPEQLQRSLLSVDRRADVYSLGASLYELLSDKPFFDGESEARLIEQVIREEPKPLSSVAPSVPEDLAAIVHKATDKDPAQRYESAQALAADFDNFLEKRPITARPPTAAYLLKKWIARNRALTSAIAAAVVILVAGAITSWVFAVEAERNADMATQNAQNEAAQRKIAEENAGLAAQREAEARHNAEETKEVADFQTRLLSELSVDEFGHSYIVKQRKDLKENLERLGRAPEEVERMLKTLDETASYGNPTNVAQRMLEDSIFEPAVKTLEKAYGNRPLLAAMIQVPLARTLENVALYELGERMARAAVEARRTGLGSEDPGTLDAVDSLATLLQSQGKFNEAEQLYFEALAGRRKRLGDEHADTLSSIHNLAYLLQAQSKLKEAEPLFREAVAISRKRLGNEHPDTLSSINSFARLLQAQGKLTEAEPLYREALAGRRMTLGDEHPSTLISIDSLASLLHAQGKLTEAEQLLREALAGSRKKLGDEHPNTLDEIDNLAALLYDEGRLSDAEPLAREALAGFRKRLGDEHPDTLISINNLAYLCQVQGKLKEAEPLFREALAGFRKTFGDVHVRTSKSALGLALTLQGQGRFPEAESLLEDVIQYAPQVEGDPSLRLKAQIRLRDLYREWQKVEPSAGHNQQADELDTLLEKN